ncbi:hypothetical protein KL933_002275 [Ogataea haglerorum]|uniref:glucan endo-1,3-beta-D-glucosidase n=1 Tax=Ogataea haglerorum TaxID=1937702 RepID=A0AAN6I0V8_9ASCO|nr:hypothetical protein KL933_002275 [Ogataea haglerorum]
MPPPIPPRDYGRQQIAARGGPKASNDLFRPISCEPPALPSGSVHPVPLPRFYKQDKPIQTNNFYGNLLVGEQTLPVWTHPYSVWYSKDPGFIGLGISHTDNSQKVFGDDPNANPVKYFFNPVGICSLLLTSQQLQRGHELLVGECERFSCGVKFTCSNGSMSSKLVQGMGFVTALYDNISPMIKSKVGIQSFQQRGASRLRKYVATLFDQTNWVIYSSADLQLADPNTVVGTVPGIVQVAKLSGDERPYDAAAGAYVVDMTLSGSVDGAGRYCFEYKLEGSSASGKTIQWALPHQYTAFDQSTASEAVSMVLDSTCKGPMKAYLTTRFVMEEQLPPAELQFEPWSQLHGFTGYSQDKLDRIRQIANEEVDSFDVVNASNTDSMYTAGKILDKGAFMLYVVAFILKDAGLARKQLGKMKCAFHRFVSNQQQAPLVYETNWKGVVSTGGLSDGNFYVDFGNCFYNDHHFHYGYHIHAAALVALADRFYGDNSFLNFSKAWIETLIRDVANPSSEDPYFPVFRSFDFFNGHSFANGLFAHGDGKDEESSSEDYHCYYGIKLWGVVTGNSRLDNLACLILGIEKRAMNMYMLYRSDNIVVPANFKANKVSGILFENKIDHATYFGMNKEYIHGIHMLPITPISSYIRDPQFVQEEWNEQLSSVVGSLDDGWKGILMLNRALFDPKSSYEFFSAPDFQYKWLDNGMSRLWAVAFAAGVGG